jgi:diadenosine tetraphosphate (Ap4A) HIT family hydrolase
MSDSEVHFSGDCLQERTFLKSKEYDSSNVFYKILKKEIPCCLIYEDDYVISFNDINPKAATHILVVPKVCYSTAQDFHENADAHFISCFYKSVAIICKKFGLDQYQLKVHCGKNEGQEVMHYHVHIMSQVKH